MDNLNNLCPGCMKEVGVVAQCPDCGYRRGTRQPSPFLPAGTIIDGRYYIGRVLESNGDGATYIAWHIDRDVSVTVREFLPDAIAGRNEGETWLRVMSGCEAVYADCMQSFLELWRKLARMRGLAALFPVFDIVEENNTVYAVSEYVEGVALRDYLLRLQTGYISWEQARVLFMPVLSTLGALHNASIIHRGLSPATLIVCRDGRMRIGGFSIWQVRSAVGELNAELADGFAAVEQYGVDLQQGKWTDVYSLGAVLYRTLIGAVPLDASKRVVNDTLMIPARFAERLPSYVIEAMINALQVMAADRTKTIEQLRDELSGAATPPPPRPVPEPVRAYAPPPAPTPTPAPTPAQPAPQKKKGSDAGYKVTIVVLLVLLLCGLALLGVYVFDDEGRLQALFGKDSTVEQTTEAMTNEVQVPNFVGKMRGTIQNSLAYGAFSFEFVDEYSTEPIDTVVRQSIEADTPVRQGTVIKLYVSIGPRKVTLPNLVGLTYEEAELKLREKGLKGEKEISPNNGTQEVGIVERMSPGAGQVVDEGTSVKLYVWGEPETQTESETRRPNSLFPFLMF